MPSILTKYISEPVHLATSDDSTYDPPHRASTDNGVHPVSGAKSLLVNGTASGHGMKEGKRIEGVFLGESDGINTSLHSLPNGRASDSTGSQSRTHSRTGSKNSMVNGNGSIGEYERSSSESSNNFPMQSSMDQVISSTQTKRSEGQTPILKPPETVQEDRGYRKGHTRAHSSSAPQNLNANLITSSPTEIAANASEKQSTSNEPSQSSKYRFSSPPTLSTAGHAPAPPTSSNTSLHPVAPRLHHRHTLEVPRISTSRTSRDFSYPGTASEGSESGRFSPTPRTPRASNTLARAPTRSVHSDMYLDEMPPDSDISKWTESIRQKRASRRKRKEEEDEEKVLVGTKVDMHHVNWVTAYNMLTGIRFTVSRTNAKMDRELIDNDFDAKHKFSFDM